MKAINTATFTQQLAKAGLLGLPFLWTEEGVIEFAEGITAAQRAAVLAVYEAHDPEAPAVPRVVTRRQARQALVLAGISFASVQAAIDAIEDPTQRALMQIEWDDSQEFHRDRPQLISLAKGALGMTDEQLDQLFISAAQL